MFLLFSSRDHTSTDVTLIDVVSSWPMRIRNFNVKIMLDNAPYTNLVVVKAPQHAPRSVPHFRHRALKPEAEKNARSREAPEQRRKFPGRLSRAGY